MSIMRLPTGLSFDQAKKDAKALAKSSNVSLSSAQDAIAKKHSRSTWSEITQHVKNHRAERIMHDLRRSAPESCRTLTFLMAPSSSENSTLLCASIDFMLSHKRPVLILVDPRTMDVNDTFCDMFKVGALQKIKSIYKELLQIIPYPPACGLQLDDVMLHGAALVVDTPWGEVDTEKDKIMELIRVSKHTIVSRASVHDWSGRLDEFEMKRVDLSVVFSRRSEVHGNVLGWGQEDIQDLIRGMGPPSATHEEFILVSREQIEKHRMKKAAWFVMPNTRIDGKVIYSLSSDSQPERIDTVFTPERFEEQESPAKIAIKEKYKRFGLEPDMEILRLHPTLLVSRRIPKPRLNHFTLTVEIPKLDILYEHKSKFIRPYRNTAYIRTDVPLFFCIDLLTSIELEDEPLVIIYRWSIKNGFEVTHTMKVWLSDPEFIDLRDGLNPLGYTYQVDEIKRYSFHDWQTVVPASAYSFSGEERNKAVSNSKRFELGITRFTTSLNNKDHCDATIEEEFDCVRKMDIYLGN